MKRVTFGLLVLVLVFCTTACCTDPVPLVTPAANHAPTATCKPTPASIPTLVSPTLAATACDKLAFASGSGIYIVNADSSDPVQVADVPSGYVPIDLQWSPDGKQLAYRNAEKGNPWAMTLSVVRVDGTDQRPLANDLGWTDYGWSPDSQYIWTEYCSRSGECTFFLQSAETGEDSCSEYYLRQVTPCLSECFPLELSDGRWWSSNWGWSRTMVVSSRDRTWALCPNVDLPMAFNARLSPDEKWVAFGTWDATHAYSWHIAKSNGDELRMLRAGPHDEFCGHSGAWSPDARSFVFASHEGSAILIWVVEPVEGSESLVARLEGRECPEEEDIKWSADGRRISMLVDDYVDSDESERVVRVCTVSVPGGEASCFPLDQVPERCSWSPEGNWLACAGASLTMIRSINGERVDLATQHTREIEWSPTGRRLAFSTDGHPLTDDDGEGSYVFDLVTRETVQLSDEGASGFDFSPSCK